MNQVITFLFIYVVEYACYFYFVINNKVIKKVIIYFHYKSFKRKFSYSVNEGIRVLVKSHVYS